MEIASIASSPKLQSTWTAPGAWVEAWPPATQASGGHSPSMELGKPGLEPGAWAKGWEAFF